MRRTFLLSKLGLLVLVMGVGILLPSGSRISSAIAQPISQTRLCSDVANCIRALEGITRKHYSFDSQGTLIGRTEADYANWERIAGEIAKIMISTNRAAIDSAFVESTTQLLLDPVAWESDQLDRALGHIGSPAIDSIVRMINGASDGLVRQKLSDRLASVAMATDPKDLNETTIARVTGLLNDRDRAVAVMGAARALGNIGPRARNALPALERKLQEIRLEETGPRMGIMGVDIVGVAISSIKGEPVHVPY